MTVRAGSLTMDSEISAQKNKLDYLYTPKNKKQEIGHLSFPPQKDTQCQLARKNINTFHPLMVDSCSLSFAS